jgi:hypothetical protein
MLRMVLRLLRMDPVELQIFKRARVRLTGTVLLFNRLGKQLEVAGSSEALDHAQSPILRQVTEVGRRPRVYTVF